MTRSPDERAQTERLSQRYPLHQSEVMREIERSVCGCDYGATSWATQSEVREIAALLRLGPGTRLLDIGSGSGWPALYWARTTGCDAVLVDLPLSAMRIAAERAAAENLSGECWAVVAEGAALPFRDASFDSVGHLDVLCCLEAKLGALRECRRVIRAGGRMVFTVISIPPNLNPADHALAVRFGPPFVATTRDYPAMLQETGWAITQQRDLTADYAKAVQGLLHKEEMHAEALSELFGPAEFAETLSRRRKVVQIIGDGFLRRELFAATPAPTSILSAG